MIDINHVFFQYSGAEQENLQDFNLQIERGECVVLTGESGCGKTCVTRLINTLIPHFYEGEMVCFCPPDKSNRLRSLNFSICNSRTVCW